MASLDISILKIKDNMAVKVKTSCYDEEISEKYAI